MSYRGNFSLQPISEASSTQMLMEHLQELRIDPRAINSHK